MIAPGNTRSERDHGVTRLDNRLYAIIALPCQRSAATRNGIAYGPSGRLALFFGPRNRPI